MYSENFQKFPGKWPQWSLFSVKLQAWFVIVFQELIYFVWKILFRCMPDVSTPTNIFQTRVTGLSSGRMKCVPTVYNRIMQCGEQGTRCVCKAGGPLFFGDADRNLHNKCRYGSWLYFIVYGCIMFFEAIRIYHIMAQ